MVFGVLIVLRRSTICLCRGVKAYIHILVNIVCYNNDALLMQYSGAAVYGTHLCWQLPPQGPGPQSPGLEPSR